MLICCQQRPPFNRALSFEVEKKLYREQLHTYKQALTIGGGFTKKRNPGFDLLGRSGREVCWVPKNYPPSEDTGLNSKEIWTVGVMRRRLR